RARAEADGRGLPGARAGRPARDPLPPRAGHHALLTPVAQAVAQVEIADLRRRQRPARMVARVVALPEVPVPVALVGAAVEERREERLEVDVALARVDDVVQ